MKTCTKCHGLYPPTKEWFYFWGGKPVSQCKRCKRAYQRTRPQSPEQSRRQSLRRKYGITAEQYDEILARQGGGCALCGTETQPSRHPLSVDHNHETGEVRGILCKRCNSLLAVFDDKVWFWKAVSYLAR